MVCFPVVLRSVNTFAVCHGHGPSGSYLRVQGLIFPCPNHFGRFHQGEERPTGGQLFCVISAP